MMKAVLLLLVFGPVFIQGKLTNVLTVFSFQQLVQPLVAKETF